MLSQATSAKSIRALAITLSVLVVFSGCNGGKPVAVSEEENNTTPTTETEPASAGKSESPEKTSVAAVDAESLNEEGQIVLHNVSTQKTDSRESLLSNPNIDESGKQILGAGWDNPQAVLYLSGQQHGYIEPCGCTGLDNQKGGLIRRDTLLTQFRDRGWNLIPVDVGNQVRRRGRQAEIKFQTTVDAFELMGYEAATLGVDDLKLNAVELIQVAGSDELKPGIFLMTNITIYDPSFFPTHKIIEAGGRKIGITAVFGDELTEKIKNEDVTVSDPVEALKPVMEELKRENCDYIVLLAHATIEQSTEIAQQVPGFDLVITAGGVGEPTLNPEKIDGSAAVMVQVGVKGQYGGIVGIFDDAQRPIRYQKIPISSEFEDSERMLAEFASYQDRLKDAGFDALGASATGHPTGREFVGSETCGECHTTAFEIWENSPHFHATDSIVKPDNDRGGIARHFDPECVSCHATGWNAVNFYPYATGFISPESTPAMIGNGCENCHGPGKNHVDAEYGDVELDDEAIEKLRQQMVLSFKRAKDKCLECHDLDNSPDFEFDAYWEEIEHYGKD